jgi:hypothetical protein
MNSLARILLVCCLTLAGVAQAQTGPSAQQPEVESPPEEAPPTQVAPPPPVLAPASQVEIQPLPDEKPEVKPSSGATKPVEPVKRIRAASAIIQALDKVTAETLRFQAPVGQAVRYKSLVFTVRACESAAPDEMAPESAAYVQVDSQPKPQPGRPSPPTRQVFKGWMFASSPALNPLQHPVYDAWLIACKAS